MLYSDALRQIGCLIAMVLVGLLGMSAVLADEPIDWNRAQQLHQRAMRGEQLSAEDQAYLNRAIAEHNRQQPQQPQPGGNRGTSQPTPPPPPRESTGMTPLTDFKPDQKYKGVGGGLYPDGGNAPSGELAKLAAALAAKVVPLNAAGQPAADGHIVLMSVGMSNTTGEFSRFKRVADDDAAKSAALWIVDGAQGGRDAAAWIGEAGKNSWAEADRRLVAAGAAPPQVEVLWIKQAIKMPSTFGEFPRHSDVLRDDNAEILKLAKARYPNLRLAFVSSRIYGGYAHTALNPEPYAYEGAFAVRGLIALQASDPSLNADPAKGNVKAPLALWGPYLWADGVKGRAIDDLVWNAEDLGGDGTHPSESGAQKVVAQLLKFFKTDANAKPWFTGKAAGQ